VDMGAFYLDVTKDRMYTTAAASIARRSAQTAMYWIMQAMVRWIAPILSFTAEELWRYLPGEKNDSVFLNTWTQFPQGTDQPPSIDWSKVLEVRSAVSRELEKLRVAGSIGAPLDAEVELYCPASIHAVLQQLGQELHFALITSAAHAHTDTTKPSEATATAVGDETIWVAVRPCTHQKCVRCWHKQADVGTHAAHPELCGRCVSNIEGPGEQRHFV
jgi:isoleucyl-tRNA synthetase